MTTRNRNSWSAVDGVVDGIVAISGLIAVGVPVVAISLGIITLLFRYAIMPLLGSGW